MNVYLIHYISLAISQKEWSVLDKAIEPMFKLMFYLTF